MGTYYLSQLKLIKSSFSCIKDVRGLGLMLAIEFIPNKTIDIADKFINLCVENKMIVMRAKGNVVRIIPPLIVSRDEIDESLKIIKICLTNLQG